MRGKRDKHLQRMCTANGDHHALPSMINHHAVGRFIQAVPEVRQDQFGSNGKLDSQGCLSTVAPVRMGDSNQRTVVGEL